MISVIAGGRLRFITNPIASTIDSVTPGAMYTSLSLHSLMAAASVFSLTTVNVDKLGVLS
jgi:hypothetical protein